MHVLHTYALVMTFSRQHPRGAGLLRSQSWRSLAAAEAEVSQPRSCSFGLIILGSFGVRVQGLGKFGAAHLHRV